VPAKQKATKTENRGDAPDGLSAEELAALKETVKERKAAARGKVDGEADLRAKIADMPPADRALAQRIHAIVIENAPELEVSTWYGMPAYKRDGKVVCFFQAAAKFKARYATFGFNEEATIDEGSMWPTSWAVTKLTNADEKAIAALVRKAVGRG
jgi:uncharacterized protein YdhG (YjbR/CyaY superfamily)